MRGLLQEISALSRGVADRTTMDVAVDDKGAPMHKILNEVQKCFLRRYKRCLVVYHSARCDRIENMRWNTGAVLPAGKRDNMHATEVDYFKAYSGAVSRYLDGCKIDLTAVRAGAPWARPRRASLLPHSACAKPQPSAEPQAAQAGPHPRAGHRRLRRGADGVGAAQREQGRDALYEPQRGGAARAPGPHDPGAVGLAFWGLRLCEGMENLVVHMY